jgi:hypothetical protein
VVGYYQIFLFSNAAFCTLLYPLVAYLIAFHSPKEIGPHRWSLLYAASHCYALVLLFGTWQPVPLFPLMVATSRGWVHGMGAIKALSSLMMVLIWQLSIGYCFGFIHYYSALAPLSALSRHYGERRNRVIGLALGIGEAGNIALAL